MAVHRIHSRGGWHGVSFSTQSQIVLDVYEAFQNHLGPDYEKLIKCGISDYILAQAGNLADQGDLDNAKLYLRRSIVECPLNNKMRMLDKLILLVRLYIPQVYRVAKRLQTNVSSISRHQSVPPKKSNVNRKDGA